MWRQYRAVGVEESYTTSAAMRSTSASYRRGISMKLHDCTRNAHFNSLCRYILRFCSAECVGAVNDAQKVYRGAAVDTHTASDLSDQESLLVSDEHGVPVHIQHYKQAKSPMWDVFRKLKVPSNKGIALGREQKVFTHLCTLCVTKIMAMRRVLPDAWEGALCNVAHTTNGKKHLARQHPDHPLAQDAQKRTIKWVQRSLEMIDEKRSALLRSELRIWSNPGRRRRRRAFRRCFESRTAHSTHQLQGG